MYKSWSRLDIETPKQSRSRLDIETQKKKSRSHLVIETSGNKVSVSVSNPKIWSHYSLVCVVVVELSGGQFYGSALVKLNKK